MERIFSDLFGRKGLDFNILAFIKNKHTLVGDNKQVVFRADKAGTNGTQLFTIMQYSRQRPNFLSDKLESIASQRLDFRANSFWILSHPLLPPLVFQKRG